MRCISKSASRSASAALPGRNEARTRKASRPSRRSRLAGCTCPGTGGSAAVIAPSASMRRMPCDGMTPSRSACMVRGMVGLARFELTTFRPPVERATRLRYSPTAGALSPASAKGKGKAGGPRLAARLLDHHRAQRPQLGHEAAQRRLVERPRRAGGRRRQAARPPRRSPPPRPPRSRRRRGRAAAEPTAPARAPASPPPAPPGPGSARRPAPAPSRPAACRGRSRGAMPRSRRIFCTPLIVMPSS